MQWLALLAFHVNGETSVLQLSSVSWLKSRTGILVRVDLGMPKRRDVAHCMLQGSVQVCALL